MKKGFVKYIDYPATIGIILAFGVLLAVIILEKSKVIWFFNLPGFILIFFGVIAATAIGCGIKELMTIPKLLRIAFTYKPYDLEATISQLATLSEKARREGLLKLEDELKNIPDSFLREALQLVIDGTDTELLNRMMRTKIENLKVRHKRGEAIFSNMGGYAPTLGMIGAVMGLLHVLAEFGDMEKVGPGIAQAFCATFYGIASANLIFLPIAAKLRLKSEEEMLQKEMIVEGILSIQSGDNPRILREKLATYLPSKPVVTSKKVIKAPQFLKKKEKKASIKAKSVVERETSAAK